MAYPADIYTEPDADPDTLANLGPLRALAGSWQSEVGATVHPVASGDEHQQYWETYDLAPIDPQTNGPQLFYGLRYHVHIVKPGEVETFHDQVGYWLWEPATGRVLQTIAIPRGQSALCGGTAAADDLTFTVSAKRGDPVYGISSQPFLDDAFRTEEVTVTVTANPDGTWTYDETTTMSVRGRPDPVLHTDRNTLTRVAPAVPNPLMARS